MQTLNIALSVIIEIFYFMWRIIKSKFFYIPVLVLSVILGVNTFFDYYRLRTPVILTWQSPIELREVRTVEKSVVLSPIVEAKEETREETKTEVVPEPKQMWAGKATWYGAKPEWCLGCDPNFIMANGEKLDDAKKTIAFNHAPLGTMVQITNVANGLSEMVEVTDTGGFNDLGRIADMSVALKNSLQCSDICEVTVATF